MGKYINKNYQMAAENGLLKLTIIVLGLGLLVNGFISYSLSKRARTIITPPVVNRQFEVSGTQLSEEYVRLMTRYIVGLALNYHPGSVRTNFNELLVLAAPETYNEMKQQFYQLADSVETMKIVNLFWIDKIEVNDKDRTIEIHGNRRQYVNDQKIKDGAENYSVKYQNNNGKFAIEKIVQVQR